MDKHIAIIGAGRMGVSISDFLLGKGFSVTLITRTREQAQLLNDKWQKSVNRQLKYGTVSEQEAPHLAVRYSATNHYELLNRADIIIESVNEDIEIKRQVYQKIALYESGKALVASNSSSILPLEIAEDSFDPSRLLGLHFFFPVAVSNLVELVRHPLLAPASYQLCLDFVRACGLTVLEQGMENAFILNMLSMAVGGEAFRGALKFGVPEANELSKSAIFPLGAFDLFDHVQIPVILEATKRYFSRDPLKNKESYRALLEFMRLMVPKGPGTCLKFADITYPQTLVGWQADLPALSDTASEFQQRLFYLHLNSCLFAVEQNLIAADSIDEAVKAVMGTQQGPLELVEEIGADRLRTALTKYHAETGAQYYRPSALLN